MANHFKHKFNK